MHYCNLYIRSDDQLQRIIYLESDFNARKYLWYVRNMCTVCKDIVLIILQYKHRFSALVSFSMLSHNMVMEKLRGKHVGTNVFIYNGYVYHLDKRNQRIYRCSARRSLECYATLIRNPNETYILKVQHNHPANDTILQQMEMKQEMLQMCRETVMKPKEIFDMVCRR